MRLPGWSDKPVHYCWSPYFQLEHRKELQVTSVFLLAGRGSRRNKGQKPHTSKGGSSNSHLTRRNVCFTPPVFTAIGDLVPNPKPTEITRKSLIDSLGLESSIWFSSVHFRKQSIFSSYWFQMTSDDCQLWLSCLNTFVYISRKSNSAWFTWEEIKLKKKKKIPTILGKVEPVSKTQLVISKSTHSPPTQHLCLLFLLFISKKLPFFVICYWSELPQIKGIEKNSKDEGPLHRWLFLQHKLVFSMVQNDHIAGIKLSIQYQSAGVYFHVESSLG